MLFPARALQTQCTFKCTSQKITVDNNICNMNCLSGMQLHFNCSFNYSWDEYLFMYLQNNFFFCWRLCIIFFSVFIEIVHFFLDCFFLVLQMLTTQMLYTLHWFKNVFSPYLASVGKMTDGIFVSFCLLLKSNLSSFPVIFSKWAFCVLEILLMPWEL